MSNIFIPVILGTTRQGRMSEFAAKFVYEQVKKWDGAETELIDIRELKFPMDDAGESVKDAEFSAICERAYGLILVVPEHNHSFPGLLKHVLDTNLKEYIHKAVGICGVSAAFDMHYFFSFLSVSLLFPIPYSLFPIPYSL